MSDDQGQTQPQPPQQQDNSRSLNIGGMDFTLAPQPPSAQQGFSIGGVPFLRRSEPPGERFIPSWPRPPSQWGKADSILDIARERQGVMPGPFMPQASDTKSLIQSILGNKGLGGIGSGGIRALAMSGMRINDRWIKDFLAGRQMAAKLADDEYKRTLEQIELKQQQESEQYGLAFELYNDPKDQDKLKRALYQAAVKFGDQEMIDAVNRGDLTFAHKLNQARDHHLLSLMKIRAQHDKIEAGEQKKQRTDSIIREYGEDPDRPTSSAVPPVPSVGPSAPDTSPTEETAAPPAMPDEAPAEPVSPEDAAPPFPGLSVGQAQAPAGPQVAQAPQQQAAPPAEQPAAAQNPEEAPPYQVAGPMMPPPTAPPENAPEGVTQVQAPSFTPPPSVAGTVNPNMRRIAHSILMGEKPLLPRDKDAADFLETRGAQIAGQMQLQLERIRGDTRYDKLPPGQRQDAILADIRNVDPELAQGVQNLIEGGRAPTGREAAKPGFQLTFSLAHKADPSFDINTVNTRAATMRAFATGQDARTLTSMATAGHHLDSLAGVADRLNQFSTQSDWVNAVTGMYAEHFGYGARPGSSLGPDAGARIKNYDTVLHMVAPEIARAVKGAAPTLTEIKDIEGQLGANVPKETLRQNIELQRELIRARLGELKRRYDSGVGNNPRLSLGRLFDVSSSQPGFATRDFGTPPPDTLQPAIPPLPPGFKLGDGLRALDTPLTPPASSNSSTIINRQTGQRMRLSPDGTRWEPIQ